MQYSTESVTYVQANKTTHLTETKSKWAQIGYLTERLHNNFYKCFKN